MAVIDIPKSVLNSLPDSVNVSSEDIYHPAFGRNAAYTEKVSTPSLEGLTPVTNTIQFGRSQVPVVTGYKKEITWEGMPTSDAGNYPIPTFYANYDAQGNFKNIMPDKGYQINQDVLIQPEYDKSGKIVATNEMSAHGNEGGIGSFFAGALKDFGPMILAGIGANLFTGANLLGDAAGAAGGAAGGASAADIAASNALAQANLTAGDLSSYGGVLGGGSTALTGGSLTNLAGTSLADLAGGAGTEAGTSLTDLANAGTETGASSGTGLKATTGSGLNLVNETGGGLGINATAGNGLDLAASTGGGLGLTAGLAGAGAIGGGLGSDLAAINTGVNTGLTTGINTGINTGVTTGGNGGVTTGGNGGVTTGGNGGVTTDGGGGGVTTGGGGGGTSLTDLLRSITSLTGLTPAQIAALLSGAGNVAGGVLGANAAKDAAKIQADAALKAAQMQQDMFNTVNAQGAPYRGAGYGALNQIRSMLPGQYTQYDENGKPIGTATGSGYLTQQFGPEQFAQGIDPGYAFRLQQGQMANQRASNLAGGLIGGNALQGLQDYTQGMASQEYNNAFNRFQTQRGNIYNTLAGIAGIGQTAQGQANTLAQNNATAQGQLGVGAAAATAAGRMGQAAGYGGALTNAANNYLLSQLLKQNQGAAGSDVSGSRFMDAYNAIG
jgi:hypothetical protein